MKKLRGSSFYIDDEKRSHPLIQEPMQGFEALGYPMDSQTHIFESMFSLQNGKVNLLSVGFDIDITF